MALTFPRAAPLAGPTKQKFELERIDFLSPEARGRVGGVTAGFPLWKADWALGSLSVSGSDEWRAFVASLRGSQRMFYGFDYQRQLPYLYQAGLPGGHSGDAATWTVTTDSYGTTPITLNGMPANMVLSAGDYIGFRWGTNQRALVRAVETVTASGAGVLSAIAVEPALPSVVPGTAIAYIKKPTCIMKLVSGDTDVGAIGRRGAIEGGRVVAVQELLP